MSDTFTVYQLTLTEAGFKEHSFPNCFYAPLGDVVLPAGLSIPIHYLGDVIFKTPSHAAIYSLFPDYNGELGKRAILAKAIERRDKAQSIVDQIETLLKA